jgi:hypothetical protein
MPSIRRSPHSIFNRRHTRHAGFATLLGIAMTIKPSTYKEIVQLGSTE